MSYCDNCGSRVYGGKCVNCNELEFIVEQYEDLGMEVPESLVIEAAEQRTRNDR